MTGFRNDTYNAIGKVSTYQNTGHILTEILNFTNNNGKYCLNVFHIVNLT